MCVLFSLLYVYFIIKLPHFLYYMQVYVVVLVSCKFIPLK